ncbi:MAG: cyclic nucleotide-binding domain-containing protein [Candidatus Cloacimonadota bacterium]|nr:cyclic nucleotide-binding domain-containing protein [Candidatus Cloacimonadota bacterium]
MKDRLEHFDLFKGLSAEEISIVKGKLDAKKIESGEFIIKEGDSENKMYLLIDGKVAVTKKLTLSVSGDAEEKKLVTLSDSQYPVFGEIGLLGNKKRTASVVAQTNCTLLVLTENSFNSIVKNNYKFGFIIMRNLANIVSSRLENTDNNLVKLATALSLTVYNK